VASEHPVLTGTAQTTNYLYYTGMPELSEFTNCMHWYIPPSGNSYKHYVSQANTGTTKCYLKCLWLLLVEFLSCAVGRVGFTEQMSALETRKEYTVPALLLSSHQIGRFYSKL